MEKAKIKTKVKVDLDSKSLRYILNKSKIRSFSDPKLDIDKIFPFQNIYVILNKIIHLPAYFGLNLLKLIKESQKLQGFSFVPDLSHSSNFTVFSVDGSKVVASAQVVVLRNSVFEIFNVCSTSTVPGYGTTFMYQLIQYIQSITKDERYVWLGVMLNNPNFEKAIKAYINVGFKYPHVNTIAPDGKTHEPFIGLYLKITPDMFSRSSLTSIDSFKRLIKQYILTLFDSVKYSKTFINLCIPNESKSYVKLQNALDLPYEIGGSLFFNENKTNINKILEGSKIQTFSVKNGSTEQFAVDVLLDRAIYHTHPRICNRTYGCALSWPSGADMSVLLKYAIWGLHVSFVFTQEGTYVIQTSNRYKKFVQGLDMNKEALSVLTFINSVRCIFASLEVYRKISKGAKYEYINNWLASCNNFNSKNLESIMLSLPDNKLYTDYEPNIWSKPKGSLLVGSEMIPGFKDLRDILGQMGFIDTSLFLASFFRPDDIIFTSILYDHKGEFPSKDNTLNSNILVNMK
mgnify:CR=1 FL=1